MGKSNPQYGGDFSPHDSREPNADAFYPFAENMLNEMSPRGDEIMQINGPAHVHGSQPIRAPHNSTGAQQATRTQSVQGTDEVSISAEADFLSKINELPEIRQDRVNDIRAQLADGTYDIDSKLDTTVDRLLDEIG